MVKQIFSFLFFNKLIMTFSSFYLFILFYLLTNEILLFGELGEILNYLFYFIFGGVISFFLLLGIKLSYGDEELPDIESIKPLEASYIPLYLGLIIISLELGSINESKLETIILILLIFFIWSKLEKVSFFNFYWLFFNYRYYNFDTKKSSYILITKKKDIKDKKEVKSLKLKRLNNYTFLEV